MDCLSLLQGIFPTQGSNTGLPHCRQILYQLSHKEAQEYWSGWPIPSPVDLPDPGMEPGSPALQGDSLPTELLGKPTIKSNQIVSTNAVYVFEIVMTFKKLLAIASQETC